jgi:hypothetical protein
MPKGVFERTEEARANMRAARALQIMKPKSEETRQKMSETHKQMYEVRKPEEIKNLEKENLEIKRIIFQRRFTQRIRTLQEENLRLRELLEPGELSSLVRSQTILKSSLPLCACGCRESVKNFDSKFLLGHPHTQKEAEGKVK